MAAAAQSIKLAPAPEKAVGGISVTDRTYFAIPIGRMTRLTRTKDGRVMLTIVGAIESLIKEADHAVTVEADLPEKSVVKYIGAPPTKVKGSKVALDRTAMPELNVLTMEQLEKLNATPGVRGLKTTVLSMGFALQTVCGVDTANMEGAVKDWGEYRKRHAAPAVLTRDQLHLLMKEKTPGNISTAKLTPTLTTMGIADGHYAAARKEWVAFFKSDAGKAAKAALEAEEAEAEEAEAVEVEDDDDDEEEPAPKPVSKAPRSAAYKASRLALKRISAERKAAEEEGNEELAEERAAAYEIAYDAHVERFGSA